MKLSKSVSARIIAVIASAALLSTAATAANAATLTADPNYTALTTALSSTSAAINSATTFSIGADSLTTYDASNQQKTHVLITVTPSISAGIADAQSTNDGGATWQDSLASSRTTYALNNMVYVKLSDALMWSNDDYDFSQSQLQSFSKFNAQWVSATAADAPNDYNGNFDVPTASSNGISSTLDTLLSSTVAAADTAGPIALTTDVDGNSIYTVPTTLAGVTTTITFTVSKTSGLVTKLQYDRGGTPNLQATLVVAFGADVVVPVFDPTAVTVITQTNLMKRVDGLSAQDGLYSSASAIVGQAKAASKKAHKSLSVSHLAAAAKKVVGSKNIKSIKNGVRIKATYNKQPAYMCITASKGKAAYKPC